MRPNRSELLTKIIAWARGESNLSRSDRDKIRRAGLTALLDRHGLVYTTLSDYPDIDLPTALALVEAELAAGAHPCRYYSAKQGRQTKYELAVADIEAIEGRPIATSEYTIAQAGWGDKDDDSTD